jgi:hypothetical protein
MKRGSKQGTVKPLCVLVFASFIGLVLGDCVIQETLGLADGSYAGYNFSPVRQKINVYDHVMVTSFGAGIDSTIPRKFSVTKMSSNLPQTSGRF